MRSRSPGWSWPPWPGFGLLIFGAIWWLAAAGLLQQPWSGALREHGSLTVVGLLGALVGNATAVGGGIIFVPYTMLVLGTDPLEALKLSLGAQAFGMSSGALAWRRRTPLGCGLPALDVSLAVAAVLGSLFGSLVLRPGPLQVKAVFGPVSIAIGLIMLWLATRGAGDGTEWCPPARLDRGRGAALLVASLVGGLVSAWVAVGVGEVVAVAMILALGVPVERAIGTGVVLLAVCSATLASVHALCLGGLPREPLLFLILGVVVGGQFGPMVARRLGPRRLKWVFAWVAILDGMLFMAQALKL